MGVGQVEYAARIAVVDPARTDALFGEGREHRLESPGLGAGEALVEFVTLGEVAEGPAELEPRKLPQVAAPGVDVPPGEPEPVHAGVDLQVDGHRLPALLPGPREGLSHLHGTHAGFEIQLQHVRHFVGEAFSQDQDRGGDAGIAEFLRLAEREDRQGIGVMLERHPGRLDGPESIGVVLGDEHQAHRGRDFAPDQCPIAGQLSKIHLDPGGTGAAIGGLHALPGGQSDRPTSVR